MRKIKVMLVLVALVICSVLVSADPTGPTIVNGTNERGTIGIDGTSGAPVEAQAGNMTSLFINTSTLTKRWQGYYGNVTGAVTLDDASGNTIYSWAIANPQGEIYAVNHSTTPTWSEVTCFNFTDDTQNLTLAELETSLGITSATDREGVNETFNLTFTGSFNIGTSNTIDVNDGCSVVSLYVNDGYDELNFNETILFENKSTDKIIYASLLESSGQTGFGGSALDFQMIVGEDGDTEGPTQYYFYVELS